MSSGGDLRAREQDELKPALASLALRLDAFEVQAKDAVGPMSRAAARPGRLHPRKDAQIVSQ